MNEPSTIDHEVRLRMLENVNVELIKNLKEMRQEIKTQFHWTLGLAFGFVGIVILPVVTAEILGIIKTLQSW